LRTISIARLLAIVLALGAPALSAGNGGDGNVDWEFHSIIPLGYETFELRSDGAGFNVIASVENAEFDGLRRVAAPRGKQLLTRSGSPLRHYPERLTFRVTATGLPPRLTTTDAASRVNSPAELNDFLLNIGFRLKVFDALEAREIAPANVRQIGMPADVAYPERIYQVSFDLSDVPAEQRLVLEVRTPAGERFCRFHLDLM
jgi:hypothetical protein